MELRALRSTEDSINMTFKSYHTGILLRILILGLLLGGIAFCILKDYMSYGLLLLIFVIFSLAELFRFLSKRFEVIDDFFEAVKYRDFSRNYIEEKKSKDIKRLYRGFNTVNRVIREMNSEKETQHLYLQKILEMIDIGILAYEVDSGKVLWMNESFQEMLDFPSFKNISFIGSRNPEVFELLFESYYSKPSAVDLKIRKENSKVLLSNSLFRMQDRSCKLIVIHNIEETLNKTETDAWKKLLSVMTHEIMNSIAPISSLANTLRSQISLYKQEPEAVQLDIEDLSAGLGSIEKRSEGLMKFAKTYRSLNKVTKLSLEKISLKELFRDIELLMQPATREKQISLRFKVTNDHLELEADSYLLEQVLINLILNAIEATAKEEEAKVLVLAERKLDGKVVIKVADNGPGIPSEIMDQVFVPFFTTKTTGSGIGLSLCKQIMNLHGGKIQIDSPGPGGTTVSLLFNANN